MTFLLARIPDRPHKLFQTNEGLYEERKRQREEREKMRMNMEREKEGWRQNVERTARTEGEALRVRIYYYSL